MNRNQSKPWIALNYKCMVSVDVLCQTATLNLFAHPCFTFSLCKTQLLSTFIPFVICVFS